MSGGSPTPVEPRAGDLRRTWPRDQPPGEGAVELRCGGCGLEWRVHRDLLGFRLRCDCGDWLSMPPYRIPPRPRRLVLERETTPLLVETRPTPAAPRPVEVEPRPAPQATARREALEPAEPSVWIDVLELVVLGAAAFGPAAILAASPDLEALRPFAGLFASLAVIAVGVRSWPLFSGTLAAPRLRDLALAFGLGGAFALAIQDPRVRQAVGVDEAWLGGVGADLGLGWAAFLCVLGPAVFGELAFRGLLLGRLREVVGAGAGALVSALAFGLAQGIGASLPAAVVGGLVLAWLRVRSDSVVPCIVAHAIAGAAILALAV